MLCILFGREEMDCNFGIRGRVYMTKDMTTGNPLKIILLFSVPVLLGNLFQQFYSMVDTIIVGRYLGQEALAGVGATG